MHDLLIVQHIIRISHSNGHHISNSTWNGGQRGGTLLNEIGEAEYVTNKFIKKIQAQVLFAYCKK